jgi:hypothetical protein
MGRALIGAACLAINNSPITPLSATGTDATSNASSTAQ